MANDFGPELNDLLGHLIVSHPASREDLKTSITGLLEMKDVEVLDTHNTASIIFTFRADNTHYGLKIEYGAAEVTRDEAHWYELAPAELKTHHIVSHVADNYAFVLLRWLDNARTIEEVAIANEGNPENPTIQLVIDALKQDRALFESSSIIPMYSDGGEDFFIDKYRSYNAKAEAFPYLLEILKSDKLKINGREIAGPEKFIERVQNDERLSAYLRPHQAGLIHGDAHMDNLLVEGNKVFFIDPKGVDHLPLEYDTGRVLWSLTGWNAIVAGEFSLQNDGTNGFILDVKARQQYVDGMSEIRNYFSDQEYHRAKYSAAMQYLTRVSHAAVEAEATALYLRGLELFAELFDELEEPQPL